MDGRSFQELGLRQRQLPDRSDGLKTQEARSLSENFVWPLTPDCATPWLELVNRLDVCEGALGDDRLEEESKLLFGLCRPGAGVGRSAELRFRHAVQERTLFP